MIAGQLTADMDESYTVRVDQRGVHISASNVYGALHALTTLSQLTSVNASAVCLREMSITDAPDYPYRGLGVSPGQRFMTMDLLKSTVDAMSFAKMNNRV